MSNTLLEYHYRLSLYPVADVVFSSKSVEKLFSLGFANHARCRKDKQMGRNDFSMTSSDFLNLINRTERRKLVNEVHLFGKFDHELNLDEFLLHPASVMRQWQNFKIS